MKPVIGLTSFSNENKQRNQVCTNLSYIDAIHRAGGVPVQFPCIGVTEHCAKMIDLIDGLLIPGGIDVMPTLYGEQPVAQVNFARKDNDLFEMELIKLAVAAGKPILAICRGMQIANVAFGGTLYQDIPSQFKGAHGHLQSSDLRDEAFHDVYMEKGSKLAEIFGSDVVGVNTYHHQAVKGLAKGFKVVGKAPDGVIEAMESEDGLIWAVQWHPEEMDRRFEGQGNLFKAFVERLK